MTDPNDETSNVQDAITSAKLENTSRVKADEKEMAPRQKIVTGLVLAMLGHADDRADLRDAVMIRQLRQ